MRPAEFHARFSAIGEDLRVPDRERAVRLAVPHRLRLARPRAARPRRRCGRRRRRSSASTTSPRFRRPAATCNHRRRDPCTITRSDRNGQAGAAGDQTARLAISRDGRRLPAAHGPEHRRHARRGRARPLAGGHVGEILRRPRSLASAGPAAPAPGLVLVRVRLREALFCFMMQSMIARLECPRKTLYHRGLLATLTRWRSKTSSPS